MGTSGKVSARLQKMGLTRTHERDAGTPLLFGNTDDSGPFIIAYDEVGGRWVMDLRKARLGGWRAEVLMRCLSSMGLKEVQTQ